MRIHLNTSTLYDKYEPAENLIYKSILLSTPLYAKVHEFYYYIKSNILLFFLFLAFILYS